MKEFSRVATLRLDGPWAAYPLYVIPEEVIEMTEAAPLGEITTVHLPFPEIRIELRYKTTSAFAYMRVLAENSVLLRVYDVHGKSMTPLTPVMSMTEERNDEGQITGVRFHANPSEANTKEAREIAARVLRIPLILFSTKGIAQESVSTAEQVNRKRRLHGKPAIQPYIRLVVGQVYDREGNEIPEHERRHVRPHIRAGHSRRQHHGPRNSLLKTVHIPPTVVNYGAGDILPDRPRVFVLAKEKRHVMALGESIH